MAETAYACDICHIFMNMCVHVLIATSHAIGHSSCHSDVEWRKKATFWVWWWNYEISGGAVLAIFA